MFSPVVLPEFCPLTINLVYVFPFCLMFCVDLFSFPVFFPENCVSRNDDSRLRDLQDLFGRHRSPSGMVFVILIVIRCGVCDINSDNVVHVLRDINSDKICCL